MTFNAYNIHVIPNLFRDLLGMLNQVQHDIKILLWWWNKPALRIRGWVYSGIYKIVLSKLYRFPLSREWQDRFICHSWLRPGIYI